jgi:hypothetical protein
MRKYLIPGLTLVIVIFVSCQKELAEIQLEINKCRIVMGHYYGGGGMHDSARFIYNEQGRLVRWINMDGRYDYYYSGNNIIARIYTESSGQLWYTDSARYNPDNTVAEIVFYDHSGTFSPDTLHNKVIFQYQGGKVSNLQSIEYFDAGYGPQTDTTFTTLTWNGAGNIEKIRSVNNGFWMSDDSSLYQYDANPNYFKLIHPHFFLFDPEFQLQTGFETQLAYFYSKNNVSNINVYGSWDYPVVYGLDSTNKVTRVDMGGFPYLKYDYQCQ